MIIRSTEAFSYAILTITCGYDLEISKSDKTLCLPFWSPWKRSIIQMVNFEMIDETKVKTWVVGSVERTAWFEMDIDKFEDEIKLNPRFLDPVDRHVRFELEIHTHVYIRWMATA